MADDFKEFLEEVSKEFKSEADGAEQGVCPYCGGENIEYGVLEPQDDMIYYPAHCDDCGKDFKEWYKLEFDSHQIEKIVIG